MLQEILGGLIDKIDHHLVSSIACFSELQTRNKRTRSRIQSKMIAKFLFCHRRWNIAELHAIGMLIGPPRSLVRLAWPLCAVSKVTIQIFARASSLTTEMLVMAFLCRKVTATFFEVDAQFLSTDRLSDNLALYGEPIEIRSGILCDQLLHDAAVRNILYPSFAIRSTGRCHICISRSNQDVTHRHFEQSRQVRTANRRRQIIHMNTLRSVSERPNN